MGKFGVIVQTAVAAAVAVMTAAVLLIYPATAVSQTVAAPRGESALDGSGAQNGQTWREYDLTGFTHYVENFTGVSQRSESAGGTPDDAAIASADDESATAVVTALGEWILAETGESTWRGETISAISLTPQRLRVFHTPAVLKQIDEIVERFTRPESAGYGCRLRVFSVNNPRWRTTLRADLESVPVRNSGVTAWLLDASQRESFDTAMARQVGFREYFNSPAPTAGTSSGTASLPTQILVTPSGVPLSLRSVRTRSYAQDAYAISAFPGYAQQTGTLAEGFVVRLLPLLSPDEQTLDISLHHELAVVDRMQGIGVHFTSPAGQRQQVTLEQPQMFRTNGTERFRWPVGRTLLLSLGQVPPPEPDSSPPSGLSISLPGYPATPRVELFFEIDCVVLQPTTGN